jgi:hypothetical protein
MKKLLWGLAIPVMFAALLSVNSFACMDGCTPGYWKQPQHWDSWVGYEPTQLLCSTDSNGGVFDCPEGDLELKNGLLLEEATLLDALKAGGGGLNAFLRHAVAALLNGSAIGCDFNGDGGVTAMVNALFDTESFTAGSEAMESLKDVFEAENDGVCPLD